MTTRNTPIAQAIVDTVASNPGITAYEISDKLAIKYSCISHILTNMCVVGTLAISLGRRCDEGVDDGVAPWHAYYTHKDPLPMLNALKAIPS